MTSGLRASSANLSAQGIQVSGPRTAAELLAVPDMTVARIGSVWPVLNNIRPEIAEQIEIDARYAAYLERQESDIAAFRRDESLALSASLDYRGIAGLSRELQEKLGRARPASLGAAARIPGITPAALVLLLRHVRRGDPARKSA